MWNISFCLNLKQIVGVNSLQKGVNNRSFTNQRILIYNYYDLNNKTTWGFRLLLSIAIYISVISDKESKLRRRDDFTKNNFGQIRKI